MRLPSMLVPPTLAEVPMGRRLRQWLADKFAAVSFALRKIQDSSLERAMEFIPAVNFWASGGTAPVAAVRGAFGVVVYENATDEEAAASVLIDTPGIYTLFLVWGQDAAEAVTPSSVYWHVSYDLTTLDGTAVVQSGIRTHEVGAIGTLTADLVHWTRVTDDFHVDAVPTVVGFKVRRNPAHASDTIGVDVYLIGLVLQRTGNGN